ncbi:class III lanthionine synthetase LanKC N-terminal domain-containing protein [Streptococcus halichoeri]
MTPSYTYRNIEHLPSIIFGFKIHVSATFQNYHTILDIVCPYLDMNNITYKFIDKKEDVYRVFSTSELAAESGKLITIYPSPSILIKTLEDLFSLLPQKEEAIYILSDRPYKGSSLLFYRFGLIQDSANVYQDGVPTITTLEGEVWQDYPKPYFDLPPWIDDIQEPSKDESESYLGSTYEVTSIIHQGGGGNIYLGVDKKFTSPVILKEARPHILSFYNVEKKELREKEYELSLELKEKGVNQVITPIEAVDEWINSYYVYRYIQGSSLTDFCKDYGINSYSRIHKKKNLRLFKEFLNIVNSLVKILIYLHSNQLILNDIHPDNFIRDEHGKLHFIDLENSYLYGEKPFVGIESKISLKSWNFLDGKQADFHKLGNMLLFLLARLTVSEQSTVETDLLNRLLNSYGIDSNLSKFITYLLSGEVTKDGLVKWLESLDATSIDIDEVLPPKTDLKDSSISFIKKVERSCLEFDKYKKYLIDMAVTTPESEDAIIRLMNLERNLGLEGLSGVIVLVDNQGLKNIAEAGINILLNRLEETDDGLLVPIEGGCYSPYICNGLSGVIQMLYYTGREKHRRLILKLRKALYVEFAQYEDYRKGMLGIADTLLLTSEYRNSKKLHQCIESLLLNSYLYHTQRHLPLIELQEVLSHYHDIYTL